MFFFGKGNKYVKVVFLFVIEERVRVEGVIIRCGVELVLKFLCNKFGSLLLN